MSFEDCVKKVSEAAGRPLQDQDIERLFEDVRRRADRMRRERVDLAEAELLRAAADALGAEAEMAARIEARNAKLNLVKRIQRRDFYAAAPTVGKTPGIVMGLYAKLVGVNTPFAGSRLSVDAQANALVRDYVGGFTVELDKAGLFQAARSGAYRRDIARELFELSSERGAPGVSGSKPAQQIAAIIHKYQRVAVEGMNRHGAWIGQYDGYIARTAHDPDLIRRAGYEAWRKTVLENLDADRTFDGVADPEKFLKGVYNGLVTGVHLTQDGLQGFKDPAFSGPGNLAKRLSAGRVLHWKDADAWSNYMDRFAGGDLMHNVVQGLNRAARHTALMKEFGTNPRAEFDADLKFLAERWRDRDTETVSELDKAKTALSNRFDELDGTAAMPVNRLGARIGASMRVWQSMAKLGGVVLSAITDVPLKASELRYQGVGLLEAYGDGITALLRGRGADETGEIIDLLRAGLDGMMGDVASRFDAHDTAAGTLSKMANTFFRWSGLTYWTDAQRAGAELVMSRHLGRQADKPFAELAEETRRSLRQFGITPAEWEAFRGAGLVKDADGRAYATPDAAQRISDEALDGVVGARLTELKQAALDQLAAGAKRVDRLEARLGRLSEVLAKTVPSRADADTLWTKAVLEAWRRQAEAIDTLRNRIVQLRDGERSTNQVLQTMRLEIADLSKDQRRIAQKSVEQVGALLDRIPKSEARRAEAETAMAELRQDLVRQLDDLDALPDRLAEALDKTRRQARDDLALKLHSYFSDRGQFAVLNPGANERAMLRRGTRPGTLEGEVWRFVAQFKAFPVAVISKAWGREIHGGQGVAGATAGMVHMMVASTVFGYLAMSLKEYAKGRNPRDPRDPKVWLAAFIQGGGAGLYGDYLFGEYSRFGRSMLASLAGPNLGQLDSLVELWTRARRGDDVAARMLQLGIQNAPFANLFYTRAALDYLVLYQVQEALNPGFLRRYEKRVKEQNGQTFWLRPTSALGVGR